MAFPSRFVDPWKSVRFPKSWSWDHLNQYPRRQRKSPFRNICVSDASVTRKRPTYQFGVCGLKIFITCMQSYLSFGPWPPSARLKNQLCPKISSTPAGQATPSCLKFRIFGLGTRKMVNPGIVFT